MFGPKKVTKHGLAAAMAAGIAARRDLTHLYLMYEAGGTVTVKWEAPRGDRRQRFRITPDGPDGDACPHCAVLIAVERLGVALPLDDERIDRVTREYESTVQRGMLPCPAFGRSPSVDTPFGPMALMLGGPAWMAECHVGYGDPHTMADCADHRAAR
ncbi:hypothetical protein ACQPXM_08090 [Kribbella sp. CA-253562]|uniref:hypothetical protein n=1 Tax=Kribbella sp. CA-253562 TaxID=3239942 RepID=UPI003D8F59B3